MAELLQATLVILAIGSVPAVATTAVWALLRRRARRIRRMASVEATRSRLEPRLDVEALSTGTETTLRGELHVVGECCRRQDDGAPAAICTLAVPPEIQSGASDSMVSHRSERLYLQVGVHRIQLDGELDVLVGSREGHPADRVDKLAPELASEQVFRKWRGLMPAIRSVHGGDEVFVHGLFERRVEASSAAADYRAPAARLSLRGPAEGIPLTATATGGPTLAWSLRRIVLWRPLLVGALLMAPFATLASIVLFKGWRIARTCDDAGGSCRSAGLCTYRPFAYRCVADSDADCRRSEHCRAFGDCALGTDGETCRPGSAQDCLDSSGCAESGLFCVLKQTDRFAYCSAASR